MENENIYENENTNETTQISVVPEVIDGFKYCIHCNEKIDVDMNFCSFCGKSQSQSEENNEKHRAFNYSRKKRKKISSKKRIMSIIAGVLFGFSFISFATGFIRLVFFNHAVISLFGSNSEQLIVNQTAVTGNLLISLIFLVAGIYTDYKK